MATTTESRPKAKTPARRPIAVQDDGLKEGELDLSHVEEDDDDAIFEVDAFSKPRPKIRVNLEEGVKGPVCELKLMREFGIADQTRLKQDGARMQALVEQNGLTHKEGKELKTILDRIFDKVLVGLDGNQKEKVSDEDRQEICTAFTYGLLLTQAALAQKRAAAEETDEDEPDDSTTES